MSAKAYTPYPVKQPAGVATNGSRQFLSDLQILMNHPGKTFVDRYGNQRYTFILDALGLKEAVGGRDFYHHESLGKLTPSFKASAAVTQSAKGAAVTLTLSSGDHWNGGKQSPGRVGDVVYMDSSNLEGKITAKSTSVDSAHTVTIQPYSDAVYFQTEGEATAGKIDAGEVFIIAGAADVGERSTQLDSFSNLTEKVSFSTTEIRDDWEITDRAMMEEIEFQFNGQNYYTLKGMQDMARRYLNTREFKLMRGTKTTKLSNGSVGTQGLLDIIAANGQEQDYNKGSMAWSEIQNVVRGLDDAGGAMEYHWLADPSQFMEITDTIFTKFSGGPLMYQYAGGSPENAAMYGFTSLSIGPSYVFHFKKFLEFSTQALVGQSSPSSKLKDFGILIPMDQWNDPVQGNQIPTLRIRTQTPPGKPEIISADTGMMAPTPTNNTASRVITSLSFAGIEVFAANQFVQFVGS